MYKITKDKLTFILFLVGMSLSLSTILNGYQIMSNWIQKYESQDGISKYNALKYHPDFHIFESNYS